MHIPKNVLPSGLHECKVHVKVSPTGPFQFPEDTELVSGLYSIEFTDFTECVMEPVEVELQHCAAAKQDDETLAFVECAQEALPSEDRKQFKELFGGTFSQHDRYGKIQLKLCHSSLCSIVGIVSKQQPGLTACQPKSSPRRYLAQVYYSSSGIQSWEVHFIITWKLDILLSVSIQ